MSNPYWWKKAVFYQIYPRSFHDSNNDGIGDLAGITDRLKYIANLGVDAIWISHFFQSPMADFGYDISDYRTVDPLFGTNIDFDLLLSRAHDLGLKIIIDMVLSHTSIKHPWFIESQQNKTNSKADWYAWSDDIPNNWVSVFGGPAWEWNETRQQYYLHNFLKEQPDLNFQNPDVQIQVLEECRYWLDKGIDGFRLDVINFSFHDKELRNKPPRRSLCLIGLSINQPHAKDRAPPNSVSKSGPAPTSNAFMPRHTKFSRRQTARSSTMSMRTSLPFGRFRSSAGWRCSTSPRS